MAKVGILIPYPELKDLAESLVPNYPRITPMCIEYVVTSRIAARVQELADNGCELIVARGLHARIARSSSVIPVVEMRVSTQDLGILVRNLKSKLQTNPNAPGPCKIGIIGFSNMFHETDHLSEFLGIDISVYTARDIEQLSVMTDKAVEDGCSGVIGGEFASRRAAELGIPSMFLSMGEESMNEALNTASLLCYANDLRKRANVEMETMLTYMQSGVMQIGNTGLIQRVNRACAHLLGVMPRDLVGQDVRALLPDLKPQFLEDALLHGQETLAEVVIIHSTAVMLNIIPIQIDGVNDGAILTFQEEKEIIELDSKLRQEHFKRGYIPRFTFDYYFSENKAFATMLNQLKRISKYPTPVLLLGEPGVRKGILAQCIHNASLQKGAFISMDCSALHPDDLDTLLFGKFTTRRDERTLIEEAHGGTLYLMHIEAMAKETQYKMLHLLRGWYEHNGPNLPEVMDVRLIFSTEGNLKESVRKGEFRHDLYYALSVLQMRVPPLREQREDIPKWFETFMNTKEEKYGRTIQLTPDAIDFITNYDWPGNLDQMDNLCERLIVLERKRTIDRATLELHLEIPEADSEPQESGRTGTYHDPRAVALAEILRRNFGNREKTAAELGISKTTLWRRMKKYGIDREFTI